MTVEVRDAQVEKILPFQLERPSIRGRAVRLEQSLGQIFGRRSYPARIKALVAEAAVLTALVGQTIKLRWKLSVQIRGDGPLRLMATDYMAPADAGGTAKIRAFASFDMDRLRASTSSSSGLFGSGYFAILIDQGNGQKPYQGITPLAGDSIARCAERYFEQSEQLPTRFCITAGKSSLPGETERWRGGGLLVQHLPRRSFDSNDDEGEETRSENWRRVNALLATIDDIELVGPTISAEQLIHRVFHEESPVVFPAQPVAFGCTCSAERVRRSLSIYSTKDIATMTTDDGIVTADCQFCGARYSFYPGTLGFEATTGDRADARLS